MNIELTEKQMDAIAGKTARIVVNMLNRDKQSKQGREKRYVDINKAADILGYSVYHLRRIKDQFPHIKRGDKLNEVTINRGDCSLKKMPCTNLLINNNMYECNSIT